MARSAADLDVLGRTAPIGFRGKIPCGKIEECLKAAYQFGESRGYAPELLQVSEYILHEMTPLVTLFVVIQQGISV